jgi:hypothetical protein
VISGAFNNKSVHFVGVIIVWYIYQSLFHSICNNPVQNTPCTKQVGWVHHRVCINSRRLGRVTSSCWWQSVSSLTDWHMPGMGVGKRVEFNHLRLKPALERTRDLSPVSALSWNKSFFLLKAKIKTGGPSIERVYVEGFSGDGLLMWQVVKLLWTCKWHRFFKWSEMPSSMTNVLGL